MGLGKQAGLFAKGVGTGLLILGGLYVANNQGYKRGFADALPQRVELVEQMEFGGQDRVTITLRDMQRRGFDPENIGARVYLSNKENTVVPVLIGQAPSIDYTVFNVKEVSGRTMVRRYAEQPFKVLVRQPLTSLSVDTIAGVGGYEEYGGCTDVYQVGGKKTSICNTEGRYELWPVK